MEIEAGERVEAELDAMIGRRDTERRRSERERAEEALWQASVERYNARAEREMSAQWYGFHIDQAARHRRTLEALIAHHEAEAEKFLQPDEPSGEHKENA